MNRIQLKSKIHMAKVTDGNINYEGSISIPEDLMSAVDLWEGEKVLVVSVDTGARLETYVQRGKPGSGKIIMNGGAARLIHIGDRITILGFALSDEPIEPKRVVCNETNEIARTG
jgi:aspartate 1-decarboxylase